VRRAIARRGSLLAGPLILVVAWAVSAQAALPTPPPRVVLSAKGESDYKMKWGSYCSDDGCVDTKFPKTRRTLHACEGSRIRMRIGAQARRVTVQALIDGEISEYARATRISGRHGRAWRFSVPANGPARVHLLASVRYKPSTRFRDGGFGGTLRPRTCD
jgi:hypothetical protein